jgi:phage FluMu protein Com
MKQTQIISEDDCKNTQFRKCVIEDGQCINCGEFFLNLLKKGQWIKHKCWSCKELKNTQIQYIWSHQIESRCKECLALDKAISPLMQEFVWSSETDSTQVEIKEAEERALNKIVKLPKEQLKEFLRRMNSGIER